MPEPIVDRRWAWPIGLGVVIAVPVAVACVILLRGSSGTQAPPTPSIDAPVHAPAGQAEQVATALRSLTTNPAALVAHAAQGQVNGREALAFPPGTEVAADTGSWAPDGINGGTMIVTVTVPGDAPVTYAAVMVLESGHWKVLATVPITASTVAPSPGSS